MLKELDPLLHSQLRLAIMSLLVGVEEADFSFLKKETKASSGNLSVQIDKLREAKYIEVEKTFQGNFPKTICRISPMGLNAFKEYVEAIKGYLNL